jgi:hypothetical protein
MFSIKHKNQAPANPGKNNKLSSVASEFKEKVIYAKSEKSP